MLRIRLQRIGKKKSPVYRVIVSERAKDTQAGALEILGQYNPVLKEKLVDLKADRIKHWISMGAQPSNTVHNLLVNAGVISGKKAKSVRISKKRQEKIDGDKAAAADEKKAAVEAEKVAASAEEDKSVEETPAEDPKEEVSAVEEKPTEESKEESSDKAELVSEKK